MSNRYRGTMMRSLAQVFGGGEEEADACPATGHRLVRSIARPDCLLCETLAASLSAIYYVYLAPVVVEKLGDQTCCVGSAATSLRRVSQRYVELVDPTLLSTE